MRYVGSVEQILYLLEENHRHPTVKCTKLGTYYLNYLEHNYYLRERKFTTIPKTHPVKRALLQLSCQVLVSQYILLLSLPVVVRILMALSHIFL